MSIGEVRSALHLYDELKWLQATIHAASNRDESWWVQTLVRRLVVVQEKIAVLEATGRYKSESPG